MPTERNYKKFGFRSHLKVTRTIRRLLELRLVFSGCVEFRLSLGCVEFRLKNINVN